MSSTLSNISLFVAKPASSGDYERSNSSQAFKSRIPQLPPIQLTEIPQIVHSWKELNSEISEIHQKCKTTTMGLGIGVTVLAAKAAITGVASASVIILTTLLVVGFALSFWGYAVSDLCKQEAEEEIKNWTHRLPKEQKPIETEQKPSCASIPVKYQIFMK